MTDTPDPAPLLAGNMPAFPVVWPDSAPNIGMSLRDWFAGQVIGAVIRQCAEDLAFQAADTVPEEYFARKAYAIADAMLALDELRREMVPAEWYRKSNEQRNESERQRDAALAALTSVLAACGTGRMVSRGAGGMTLEAQIHRSVLNGVPAWPIEKARQTLAQIDAILEGERR